MTCTGRLYILIAGRGFQETALHTSDISELTAAVKRLESENARFREALEKIAHCDDLTITGEYDGPELARRLRFAVNAAENAQMTQAVKTESQHAS
jgi:hypothetical protein